MPRSYGSSRNKNSAKRNAFKKLLHSILILWRGAWKNGCRETSDRKKIGVQLSICLATKYFIPCWLFVYSIESNISTKYLDHFKISFSFRQKPRTKNQLEHTTTKWTYDSFILFYTRNQIVTFDVLLLVKFHKHCVNRYLIRTIEKSIISSVIRYLTACIEFRFILFEWTIPFRFEAIPSF